MIVVTYQFSSLCPSYSCNWLTIMIDQFPSFVIPTVFYHQKLAEGNCFKPSKGHSLPVSINICFTKSNGYDRKENLWNYKIPFNFCNVHEGSFNFYHAPERYLLLIFFISNIMFINTVLPIRNESLVGKLVSGDWRTI